MIEPQTDLKQSNYNHLKDFSENDRVNVWKRFGKIWNNFVCRPKTNWTKIWCVWDKGINLAGERTMVYVYSWNYALGEYRNTFKNFFKDKLKDGKTYFDTTSGKKKDMN